MDTDLGEVRRRWHSLAAWQHRAIVELSTFYLATHAGEALRDDDGAVGGRRVRDRGVLSWPVDDGGAEAAAFAVVPSVMCSGAVPR